MAVRLNTGMQNRLADSTGTAFDSGVLEIYSGAQPAAANDAASGTLLATINLPADAFAAAAAGVVAKSGTWSATVAASGEAGWARLRNAGDTLRIDLDIGEGSGTVSLDETTLVAGGTVTVNTMNVTQPAS